MDEIELKKFIALLDHWIEHYDEHGQDFSGWAIKANSAGFTTVCEYMISAANGMSKVKDSLASALSKIPKATK